LADHSIRYRLPLPEESLPSQGSLNSRREVEVEPSYALTGKLTSYSEGTGRKKTKGSRNIMIDKFWWPRTMLPPIPMVGIHNILQSGRSVA
jgi:hypothetical protein